MQHLKTRRAYAAASGRSSTAVRVFAMATGRLKPFSSVARQVTGLSWDEMHRASLLARLAGYCYYPTNELADLTKAEGLKLVASGRTHYTSWYVADGVLDQQHFYAQACKHWAPAALVDAHAQAHQAAGNGTHSSSSSNGNGTFASSGTNHQNGGSSNTTSVSRQQGVGVSGGGAGAQWPAPPAGKRCRFVFVRGVQWGAHDGDMTAVTQALVSFWPSPLPPHPSSTPTTPTSSTTATSASPASAAALPFSAFFGGAAQQAPRQTSSAPSASSLSASSFMSSVFSSGASTSAASLASTSSTDGGAESAQQPQQPPGSALVSHTGVTRLAMDLYAALQPYIQAPAGVPAGVPKNKSLTAARAAGGAAAAPVAGTGAGGRAGDGAGALVSAGAAQGGEAEEEEGPPDMVCLAGHSMGGALAMLTMARCILLGHRRPDQVTCHTFGSFPVLAHKDGGGGHRVLQELGLSDSAVRSFVLEHDPVPRVLITADPAFQVLKRYEPIRQLLDWRGWLINSSTMGSRLLALLGVAPPEAHKPLLSPVVSAHRFVFENVGSVYLIRGGAELVPVGAADDVEELMRMAVTEFASQPARAIQAWLDHHHTSYSHDLQTAALAELKRELRKARNRHADLQHRQHAQHAQQHGTLTALGQGAQHAQHMPAVERQHVNGQHAQHVGGGQPVPAQPRVPQPQPQPHHVQRRG